MDKEDALVCFEEHIRMLEQEYDDEKEQHRRRNNGPLVMNKAQIVNEFINCFHRYGQGRRLGLF